MLSHPLICAFSALHLLPTALGHMQMLIPSPLRDPHSNRVNEPKDYNILTPLHADGSDFACKGYQWNTPWTTVATYEAGRTYEMTLKGGATHGGGSCQISLSCDGGIEFKVLKSIVGGCPMEKEYEFTIPAEVGEELGRSKATCLLGWTWFNRVGNREMYMNCAVVDIVPPGYRKKPSNRRPQRIQERDKVIANAAAQAALSAYPDLFVANLANINDCVTRETLDVVFDDPGVDIAFGDGQGASSKPSFKGRECTGRGRKISGDSMAQSSSGSAKSGNDGQWHGLDDNKKEGPSEQTTSSTRYTDGQWHPELYQKAGIKQAKSGRVEALENSNLQPVDVVDQKPPNGAVEQELDAYLARLYGHGQRDELAIARGADAETDSSIIEDTQNGTEEYGTLDEESESSPDLYESPYYCRTRTSPSTNNDLPPSLDIASGSTDVLSTITNNDSSFKAFLERLNALGETVFMLVKFASTYLDHPLIEEPTNQSLKLNAKDAVPQKRNALGADPKNHGDRHGGSRNNEEVYDEDPTQALRDIGIYVNGPGASKNPTVKQLEDSVRALEDELDYLREAIESAASEKGYSGVEWTNGDIDLKPGSNYDYDDTYSSSLTTSTRKYHKRQDSDASPDYEDDEGDDNEENEDENDGAAEILFPDVEHDTLYEWSDPTLQITFDWGQFYPDLQGDESREGMQNAEDVDGDEDSREDAEGEEEETASDPGKQSTEGEDEQQSSESSAPVDSAPSADVAVTLTETSTAASEESSQDDNREDAQADEHEQMSDTPAPVDSIPSPISESPLPDSSTEVSEESSSLEGDDDENDELDEVQQPTNSPTPETPEVSPVASNTTTSAESADQADDADEEDSGTALDQPAPGHDSAQPPEDESSEEDSKPNEVVEQQSQASRRRDEPQNASPNHCTQPNAPSFNPDYDDTAILPYILGPGPVAPPDLNITNWPSPSNPSPNLENLPPLVNDLGSDSEDDVRKWFAILNSSENSKRAPARLHARQFDTPSRPSVQGPDSVDPPATQIPDTPTPTPPPVPTPTPTPILPTSLSPSTLARLCAFERTRLLNKITLWRQQLSQPCGFGSDVSMPAPDLPELHDAMEQVCMLRKKGLVDVIGRAQELVEGGCEELVAAVGVIRGGRRERKWSGEGDGV